MDLRAELKPYAQRVDERLDALLPPAADVPIQLHEAMRYAALAPGKRLRPALCLLFCEAYGRSADDALDPACAIELIHAFSLVHDDLPALDNDELRRGRPTTWKAYGEAVGLLAGDALFALAFTLAPAHAGELGAAALRLVRGETLDILSENAPPDAATLVFIHHHKTGALIEAACVIGARCADADDGPARRYGAALGLAFQIADDILDATATREMMGKSVGADAAAGKLTYPLVHGLDAARARADALVAEAKAALDDVPGPTALLRALADFTVARGH